MVNYQEVRVKLTNTQLTKLKSAAKNQTGALLGTNKKNFQDEKLPHELFLTIRQSLRDYNGTRTHNHLVHKRTLNYLGKLAK